jgi:uncharacterized delta-60 repeat protein
MMKKVLIFLTFLLLDPKISLPAPGDLDSTFNGDGVATYNGTTNSVDYGDAVAVQLDGKIVVVGKTKNPWDDDLLLLRYNSDGTLDDTFGTKGVTIFSTGLMAILESGNAISLAPDGKIVIVGNINHGTAMLLLRFNGDGTLDDAFGNDGVITYYGPGGVGASGHALALQPDGKIVVAGTSGSGPRSVLIARYNSNGTPDTAFGLNGIVTYESTWNLGSGLALQPDGKIVVVGSTENNLYNSDVLILRYNPDGTLDNTFGMKGSVTYDGGSYDNGRAVALQKDGKILVTGDSYRGTSGIDLLVIRLNNDGSFDGGFGTGGVVAYNGGKDENGFSYYDSGYAITLQADGKIVTAGYTQGGMVCGLLIMRFETEGTLDRNFGTGGAATYREVYECTGAVENGLALQPDGKIVVTSNKFNGINSDVLVLRYRTDGTLDSAFGVEGVVTYNGIFPPGADVGNALAIQPDGKTIVAGYSSNGTNTDLLILRYNQNGTMDTSFGRKGVVRYNGPRNVDDFGTGVAIQTDGKIVVLSSSSSILRSDWEIRVLRFNPEGTLDTTFGTGGVATYGWGTYGAAIGIQPDGKIVIVGSAFVNQWFSFLLRYNADGTLDTTFGEGGVAQYLTELDLFVYAVGIQEDGKIIVTGTIDDLGDLLVLRYNREGTLDRGFGTEGVVKYKSPWGSMDYGYSIAIQPDGRFVVAGGSNEGLRNRVILARFNSDGSPDNKWNGSGATSYSRSPSSDDVALGVTIQRDRKIVVTGYSGYDLLVLRYNRDGTLDNAFAGDGIATFTNTQGGNASGTSVAMGPDGNIVITGTVHNGPTDYDVLTMRLIGMDAPEGTVTLLTPRGGEKIASGSRYTVEWIAPSVMEKFKLEYSTDNGATWNPMEMGKDGYVTARNYEWSVPTPETNQKNCYVKITGYASNGSKLGEDRSDNPFSIEVIDLKAPNGGETLRSLGPYSIQWTTNGTKSPAAKVKLYYTTNAGSTWRLITTLDGNPGRYDWSVPRTIKLKTNCAVKVVLIDKKRKTVGSDTSDNYFTILP